MYFNPNLAPTFQKREDASGFSHFKAKNFVPHFYEKGLFPVVRIDSMDDFFPSIGAEKLAKQNGSILLMEFEHWSRLGENARIFAFLPDAYINGVSNPSIITFNTILFLFSLIFLISRMKNTLYFPFAIVVVFIVSITPFYLYEVYANENTFSLMGVLFIIMIGINFKVLIDKKDYKEIIVYALVSGLILGFFSEMRGELKVLLASVLVIYLFSGYMTYIQKGMTVLLLLVSFSITVSSVRYYFDYKWSQAEEYIIENNGYVYEGDKIPSHKFWHPVFCGLGDYGKDKGYEWNDKVAYRYAMPFLEEKLGKKLSYSDKYHLDEYYDKDSIYYQKFDEIEEYESIMKEKVTSDIRSDFGWYLKILVKRAFNIMKETSPIPYVGFLIIPLLILLLVLKVNFLRMVFISSLPLSLNSFIIYSKDGSSLHGMFAILTLSILLLFTIEKLIKDKEFFRHPQEH